ncbi:hypothetical protein [Paenibacillus cymbidii]|uniref:hypothetical protein n=1 Tax=Paenibacillus cymbidii TaxID=1639034 RepID=UPI001080DE05|nr:hypothetical protein [Paenibacillus cymbidii]
MPDRIKPGYVEQYVSIASTRECILHASGQEVASGEGVSQVVGDYREALLDIDVTAINPKPTKTASVTFKLQTKVNGQWRDIPSVTLTAATSISNQTVKVATFGEEIRLTWTLTADTADITFSAALLAKS